MDEAERVPVVVIGAGQAGLAAGYFLAQASVPFLILEAAEQLGASWRSRWDSLTLFTPARYSGLPGLPFPGDPWRFPVKDEAADYLEAYAEKFQLPIRRGAPVTTLSRSGDEYRIETPGKTYYAEAVIVSTGGFQRPHLPPFAANLAPDVLQVHSSAYRNPSDIPEGTVLVVGGGNSGVQLAEELSAARGTVHLSIGSRLGSLPRRILGRDVFWWLDHLGVLRFPVARLPRWLADDKDTLVGQSIRGLLREHEVVLQPRVVAAEDRTLSFADGACLDVDAVVWATGYRPDYPWLKAPVLNGGAPAHRRGVTACPGLYFVGLVRQHSAGSQLIGWVRHDARFVVSRIVRSRASA